MAEFRSSAAFPGRCTEFLLSIAVFLGRRAAGFRNNDAFIGINAKMLDDVAPSLRSRATARRIGCVAREIRLSRRTIIGWDWGRVEDDQGNKWSQLSWLTGDVAALETPSPAPSADRYRQSTEIPYKPPAVKIALAVIAFTLAALWFADTAMSNTRGLIINGIVELGVDGATRFYWVLALVCAGMTIAGLLTIPQIFIPRQITITDEAITLPRRWLTRAHDRIAWNEIERVSLWRASGYTFLKVRRGGRTYVVNSTWLMDAFDMERIIESIQHHCGPLR